MWDGGLLGIYVERYRDGEVGNRDSPIFDGKKEATKRGDYPLALVDCMRLEGDMASNAGGPWEIPDKTSPKYGVRYVGPTARRPEESDMEGGRRSNGILHGRMVAAGLDDRPEVGGFGFLPGLARSLQIITKARRDTISIQHSNWNDGARKIPPVVYLMSQARRLYFGDLVHVLHFAVGASILFIRDGGLSYYKRGFPRELGSAAPVEVSTLCAQ